MERLLAGEIVQFSDPDDLPDEAFTDKRSFKIYNSMSTLIIPLIVGGTAVGTLSLGSLNIGHPWPGRIIQRMRLVGEIFANALMRKETEKERKRLEIRLTQAKKMEAVGTMAGGIAHDFNNALTPITMLTSMMLTELPADSPVRENLGRVLSAANRAKDLVKQILAFSRTGTPKRISVRIDLVVEEALRLISATLPANIKIIKDMDKGCGTILANPSQIQQVVMNLCINALHAMREESGGILYVSLDILEVEAAFARRHMNLRSGEYVRLMVSDTGHGMDDKTMERIFDPFYTTKDAGEGTGLGLSIVNSIVMGHEGEISVRSEPGKGTAFYVYLPSSNGTHDEEEAMETEIIPGGNQSILFIDDEERIVFSGKKMLECLGYKVTGMTNGLDALEAFRANPEKFDVVITDQTMPGMSGLHLAGELASLRPDIPIILISGFSEAITPENLNRFCIKECMMKPFAASDMAAAIRRVLENKIASQVDKR